MPQSALRSTCGAQDGLLRRGRVFSRKQITPLRAARRGVKKTEARFKRLQGDQASSPVSSPCFSRDMNSSPEMFSFSSRYCASRLSEAALSRRICLADS